MVLIIPKRNAWKERDAINGMRNLKLVYKNPLHRSVSLWFKALIRYECIYNVFSGFVRPKLERSCNDKASKT